MTALAVGYGAAQSAYHPHGFCYLWEPDLVWLHVIADGVIAAAYYAIPFGLIWFVRRRRDVPFDWMFGMFALFILACGTTHLMSIWTLWSPHYWASGFVKVVTAGASIGTAIMLVPLLPRAIALPSPRALAETNQALEREVAERRRAEEASRRLAAIVEQSEDAFIGTSPDGIVETWNAGAERLFGYGEAEMLGRAMTQIVPAQSSDELRAALSHAVAGQEVEYLETLGVRRDGELLHLAVTVSPIVNASGRVVAAATVARDVSRRKRDEAEIQRLNAALSNRVAQLEAMNRELESFSYTVSHDLRAPLRAVQGFSEALLQDYGMSLDDTARGFVHRAVEAAARMDRLIRDLLEYSRLARVELALEPVDLAVATADAAAQLERELAERRATVEILGDLPTVRGDGRTVAQAVANLLSNAVKFVTAGTTPHVRVWAEERDRMVRLWVEDNGIGIAEEHQQRIFHVFERLHAQEAYPGNGAGLAIVRRAAERMGGAAGVESRPGAGSRFWIELAAADATAAGRGTAS